MTPGHYCNPPGLHFIDMNADGLSDLACIHPNGDLHLAVNNGDGSGDNPPTFKNIGLIKTSEEKQDLVRLADIDGDGRGDYGIMTQDLSLKFWRNGWVEDKPEYWQPLGIRTPSHEGSSPGTVRFADINGDVSFQTNLSPEVVIARAPTL